MHNPFARNTPELPADMVAELIAALTAGAAMAGTVESMMGHGPEAAIWSQDRERFERLLSKLSKHNRRMVS